MGLGWTAPALLCEVKGSIRRNDMCYLLAAYMTPKQCARHQQHNDYTELLSV